MYLLRPIFAVVLCLFVITAFSQTQRSTKTKADSSKLTSSSNSVQIGSAAPAKPGKTVKQSPAPAATNTSATSKPAMEARPQAVTTTKGKEGFGSAGPFKKGTLSFINRTNLGLSLLTTKPVADTKANSFTIAIDPVYYIVDHIGIGLDARYSTSHNTTPGTMGDLKSWATYFSLTYGTQLSSNLNIYGRISAGPAHSRSVIKNSASPTTLESNFVDVKGQIGLPVLLEKDGFSYFTPYINYDRYKGTAGNHHITDNTFGFGLRLESYLPSRSIGKKEQEWSAGKYKADNSFLEFNTLSNFVFTTRKETQGTIRFGDQKTSSRRFAVGYGYYFMDNLAGGLNLELGGTTFKNGGSTMKTKTWGIQPNVLVHAPVTGPLNNAFLQLAYGYTSTKETGAIKRNNSAIDLRLGYNIFVFKNLALAPKIGWQTINRTLISSTGGPQKTKSSGLVAEIGVRTWLNFKWREISGK